MQEDPYFSNSKTSEKLPHCRKFIIAYCAETFNIYHIMTFLENSPTSVQLSIFKQPHIDLQNKRDKGNTLHLLK